MELEELNKKVDRILWHLEGDPNTKTKGLVERVTDLENGTPKIATMFSALGVGVGSALTWFLNR